MLRQLQKEEDVCLQEGLYGDGVCHLECAEIDPDCLRLPNITDTIGDRCEAEGFYDNDRCDATCPKPDPDCGPAYVNSFPTDECRENGMYGDGVCDTHCPNPDPDCSSPNAIFIPKPPPVLIVEDELEELSPSGVKPRKRGEKSESPIEDQPLIESEDEPVEVMIEELVPEEIEEKDDEEEQEKDEAKEAIDVDAIEPIVVPESATGSDVISQTGAQVATGSGVKEELTFFDRFAAILTREQQADERLQHFLHSDDSMIITYKDRARVLFIIPIRYRLTVHVTEETIEKFAPWWLFFAHDNVDEIIQRVVQLRQSVMQP